VVTHLHGWLLPALVALLLALPASSAVTRAQHGPHAQHVHARYEGHGPQWWASRSRSWHAKVRAWQAKVSALRRELVSNRRVLLQEPSVTEAINLACATFGYCSTLWSKARCESHLYPDAHNASGASGLFQFLPSTWESTPYSQLSIWSPYANAMAAGWMHAHGRGGEWVCQ
jgi:hypothetical protein